MSILQKPLSGSIQYGFTLLELMVVVLIMGTFAGLVSLVAHPDERSRLDVEALRLARLLELAMTEARVSGSAFAWTAESGAYGFLYRQSTNDWVAVRDDATLRSRILPAGMRITGLLVERVPVLDAMRVEFPAYGQSVAFTVSLEYGTAVSMIEVSPIGSIAVRARTRAQQ